MTTAATAAACAPGVRPAVAAAPYLEIRGLTKSYGPFQALKGIDLDIPPRAFVCFLGPSGCGKSTLLRVIAGLDVQTSGTIRQAGRDVSRLPPAQRDFGIVFQSYALFPNLTVFDNVGYGLVNRRMPKAQRASVVGELLTLVGLADAGAKYPNQLSGGQQQRVALARALAVEPGLLLLDEPLSALDARVRLRLRDEICALQRRLGITTVMVTHDQEEALTMADLVVVMNHGTIEQVGTPEDVYARPASRFVADFVGTMAAFAGTLVAPDRVRAGALEIACPRQTGIGVGAAVAVRIRPEAMHLVAGAAPETVAGTLAARMFHGPVVRLSIDCGLPHGDLLILEVSTHAPGLGVLEVGARVHVAIQAADVRLFAED
jgi:iron(III) transport system ATP-binding protein